MAFPPAEVDEKEMQKGRELRKEQDKEVQQILAPQQLQADRRITAKQVVFDLGEWKVKTNVLDYKGGDVRRDPVEKRIRKSVEDIVDNPPEAERILDYVIGGKTVTPHNITDFNTFKEAFRDAFIRGGKGSKARLWDYIGGQEDLLLKLYANTQVQAKVTEDSKETRVLGLMAKYNISRSRANDLFKQIRIHETQLIQEGMLPIDERQEFHIPTTLAPTTSPRRLISQAHGQTIYRRSIPTKFTDPQRRFLKNNPGVPTRKLTAQFNILFRDTRTISSIYNQRYRLLKAG